MTKRTALLSLTVALLSVFTFVQIATIPAEAHHPPLTSPLTTPLTSFVARISGRIKLKQIKFWKFSSKFIPASGVTVKLLNIHTHNLMTAETNADGVYTFFVEDKGWYKVTPQIDHSMADIVAPPFRFVVFKKHDKLHEDFQAIDLP